MSRTIVQEYGPIYGEPVNGTVMGRPNGSIAVPSMNKISLDVNATYRYFKYYASTVILICNSGGSIVYSPDTDKGIVLVAESQDLASNMQLQLFSDSALTTQIGVKNYANGSFNAIDNGLINVPSDLTDEQTVYLRAQLIAGGVPVATSDTIPMVMVVP